MEKIVAETSCPKCGASKGSKCKNNANEDMTIPHSDRVRDYWHRRDMRLRPAAKSDREIR